MTGAADFTFYLGIHHPHWLAMAGVPLFVSRASLARRKSLPRARAPWALDSGAFTEVVKHGGWGFRAREYVALVRRCRDEIGNLSWAAPMDWPCEAEVLKATGLTVKGHQRRTLTNYLQLCELAPEVPWVPVLQGWSWGDYLDHVEAYARAGVNLAALPVVGVGSVCRRQQTTRAASLLRWLQADGIKLHGFGVKKHGLRAAAQSLASADSMAWSTNARRNRHGCVAGHAHASCANCIDFALAWRDELLTSLERTAPAALRRAA